jgi:hypothetical protein
MRSTTTVPCCSSRNAGRDAQAATAPSSLPSRRYSPSKKDRHVGEAAIPPSVPSITLADVNASDAAAAVASANPCRRIACPLSPIVNVSEPVSSTLPAGIAAFPVADIMPTAALTITAKFARPESVAADVFVATAAVYSTLSVTTAATAEVAAADITVVTAASFNLATAEAVAADLPVPVDTAALSSVSSAAAEFAAAAVVVPVVASVQNEGVSFE